MDKELALRIEKSELDHFVSWTNHLVKFDKNPFGVDMHEFGNSVAISAKEGCLGPLFNRVFCLSEADLPHLTDIVKFYEHQKLPCRIDINPYQGTPTLFKTLTDSGFAPFRFHTALYLPTDAEKLDSAHSNPDIEIATVDSHNRRIWAKAWREGFVDVIGVLDSVVDTFAEITSRLYDVPGWILYLATINGAPAGTAALYVQDGIASIVIAGTVPQFRHQGCQTALLKQRIRDAIGLGCDLIVAQSALGSDSQRNMERCGLKVAYTRPFFFKPL